MNSVDTKSTEILSAQCKWGRERERRHFTHLSSSHYYLEAMLNMLNFNSAGSIAYHPFKEFCKNKKLSGAEMKCCAILC